MKQACTLVMLVFVAFVSITKQAQAQDHHDHHNMAVSDAKLLADKQESEFNHHLAGFFVALAGAFILLSAPLGRKWRHVKFVWPTLFLLAGLFVLIWSDTELWPFGDQNWFTALGNNTEVQQHKTFAVLLLVLGCIEWMRVKGSLRAAWSALVFPVLAIGGAILLIFHPHEGGMQGANHMEVMQRIQSQHLSYTIVGVGIGLAKGLSEINSRGRVVFAGLWPLLMIVLGILLMMYQE